MELNYEVINKIIDSLRLSDDVTLDDIPDIELYMDQVLGFLSGKLQSLKRDPEDKLLTKTMINNYTKEQLLMPPRNKKYSHEHIVLMILVYHLKAILSISDIKRLFSPVLKDINTSEDDVIPLAEVYSIYLDLKKDQFAEFTEHFAEKHAFINDKTKSVGEGGRALANLFLTVLMLVAQANVSKRLAEKLIDAYFPAGKFPEKHD